MDIKALRKLKTEELQERLVQKTDELKSGLYEVNTAKEQDFSKTGKLKKEIARIKTLIKESSLTN